MKINQDKTITSRTDFFYYAFRNILLVGLPLLIVSAFILSLPHSSATESSSSSNSSVDSVSLSLDISCTISSEVLKPHSVSLSGGGLHRENIGTTKIGTFCNDNNGYNIYAIGYGDNTDGNTDLVSNLIDDYNIHTGIYSNSNTTSSWSMKLTAGVGTGINPDTGASVIATPPTIINGYNSYSVIPNVYTLVASRASGTDMNTDINLDATGSYFTTTYDIYANSAQPAGTYIGKVKYIMTHPNTNAPNTINDIDAAFAIAGKQKIYYDENNNGPYFAMQDMTTDICNSVTRNGELTTTQLVDVRDKKSYYVTKLADGNCWMTQNLALNLETTPTSVAPLTSGNTDLNDNSLSGAYTAAAGYSYDAANNRITWTPANPTKTFNNNSVSGWTHSYTAPSSARKLDGTMSGQTSTGNLYNWTAAIASNNSGNYTGSTYGNVDNNPQNSICPKGWRLPTISSVADRDEFRKLNNIYNGSSTSSDANLIISPLWFVRSGRVSNGTLNNYGTEGLYWSSTVYNSSNAYNLYFGSSSVGPADVSYYGYSRGHGFSVRCLAR